MQDAQLQSRQQIGSYGAAAVAVLLMTANAACTASSSSTPQPGVVVGDAPICYGPGPDLNLKPRITIRATPIDGGSPTAIRVETSNAHHSYRMTLAAGPYKISTYSGSVKVTVHPGITSKGVDLPNPGCL
jgi:hypothetical protein